MSEITLYVSYFITQQNKAGHRADRAAVNIRSLFATTEEDIIVDTQQQAVNTYLESQPGHEKVGQFVETPENKRTNRWPQLQAAIQACRSQNARLIIAELGTLTNNESFTQILLDSGLEFYCCDQPFITQNNLEVLYKLAQYQRKHHGKLIREGLKMTSAKSGNPNAAEVISKVNKPKIDTAIVFAFLLQPIIADYRRKGYSQRQMVKTLNTEGFTAPEGGKWVLSQLQKVLDRVRLNEVATDTEALFKEFDQQQFSEAQIADELNRRGIPSLKRTAWDEAQVKKLKARLDQIHDIELINQFVLNLLPILHEYRHRGANALSILDELSKAGLPVRQSQVEVAA